MLKNSKRIELTAARVTTRCLVEFAWSEKCE